MKTYSLLKAAFTAAVVSLLAACGGGDNAAPDVAWASPAVFAGAASKSYALQGCSGGFGGDGIDGYSGSFYNASLNITSNGNVSISAATTTTGTVSVLWSLAYADAQNASWSVYGNTAEAGYNLSMNNSSRSGSSSVFAEYSPEGSYLNVSRSSSSGGLGMTCIFTTPLALQINPDQARAAKNLGSAAGVTTFDDYRTDGSIEGDNAFWQSNSESESSSAYDFMRFNLKTGDLSSSSSSTGTYASINLSLPSTTNTLGVYAESLQRNNGFYDYKEAKTICLSKLTYDMSVESESGFVLNATAYGSKLMPSSYIYDTNNYYDGPSYLGGPKMIACGMQP